MTMLRRDLLFGLGGVAANSVFGGIGGVQPAAGAAGLFAGIINAKPTEIAYVSSTSAGENLVVQALELDRRRDGNVVTDSLHFEGAQPPAPSRSTSRRAASTSRPARRSSG
jgi:hypothetical protein